MFSAEQAYGLAQFLIQGAENEFATTKKVLAALPQDQLNFKLGEKGRTAQELAWHIVTSDVWFTESLAAGAFGNEPPGGDMPSTVRGIVDYYEKAFPAGLAKVKALSGETFAKPLQFFTFNFPAVIYLSFLNNHSIHHRGQLSTYLRAMNAHVPSIYGGSADEPFEMPAEAGA